MNRFLGLILGWAALSHGAVAQPVITPRDPQQQLAAELVVLAGDVRRLQHEHPGPMETRGLQKRLLGGLASLPLTLRRAGGDAGTAISLRRAVEQRDWPASATLLAELRQRHAFDARPFLPSLATETVLKLGERIHREVCAPCHDNPPAVDLLLPARNLPGQLNSMSPEEFAARLWLGVRGDKISAYANPFSSQELSALVAWYALSR